MLRPTTRALLAFATAATVACYSTNYRSSFTTTSVGGPVSTARRAAGLPPPRSRREQARHRGFSAPFAASLARN